MEFNANVRLKIDENNVIMAKCAGFPTEIFMPTIVDGRLSIINVVPKRRCQCVSTNFIVANSAKPVQNAAVANDDGIEEFGLSNWQLTADFSTNFQASTPEQLRNCGSHTARRSLLFEERLAENDALQFDESVEMTRNCVQTAMHAVQPHGPNESASNVTRIPLGNLSNLEWPQTPIGSLSVGECSTKNLPQLDALQNLPKWRKVLTPIRTYSRRKYTLTNSSNEGERANVLPKPTDGIKAEKKVVKLKLKNHIILDEKIRISPKSFKHQQENQKSKDELYSKMCREHKNRKQQMSRKTVHDFLTRPAFQSSMSHTLEAQFLSCCVMRGVSTYPKYKKLATL